MKAAGIKHIDGDIIGDATAFVGQPVPHGWKPRWLEPPATRPRLGALAERQPDVGRRLARRAGKAASVGLVPSSSAIPITNTVKTVDGSYGTHVVVLARAMAASMARGWIGSRCADAPTVELVIEDPALFTTGALRDALSAARRRQSREGPTRPDYRWRDPRGVAALTSAGAHRRRHEPREHQLLRRAAVPGRRARAGAETVGSADLGAAMLQNFLNEKVGAPRRRGRRSRMAAGFRRSIALRRGPWWISVVCAPAPGRRRSTHRFRWRANRSCCEIACDLRRRRATCTPRPAPRTT